jgi:hypothetical protein
MFDRFKKLLGDSRAQMGGRDLPSIMIMLGIAVVVGFVILAIASETIGVAALNEGDPLYNSSQSLVDATNNVFSLFGIVFLAVILSVVVFYLYGIRGAGGRR